MIYLKNSNDICLGILLSWWHKSLVLKNISWFAGNWTYALTYRLTISDFPSYLEKKMRYLKILNCICSGICAYRWHDSLIMKNISCFAGTLDVRRTYRTYVPTDHIRCSLIIREKDEISKTFKRYLFRHIAVLNFRRAHISLNFRKVLGFIRYIKNGRQNTHLFTSLNFHIFASYHV